MDLRKTLLRLDGELEDQLNTVPPPSIVKKLIVGFLETCRDYTKRIEDPSDLRLLITYFHAREALYRMEFGEYPEVMLDFYSDSSAQGRHK